MAFRGKRSWRSNVYWRDSRTGFREFLSDLSWQRGLLLKDLDTMVIGDRESQMIRALEAPSKELQPDEKLTEPSLQGNDDDMILL